MSIDIYNPKDIAEDNYLIKLLNEGIIRKCSYCNRYVGFVDFHGETEVVNTEGNIQTHYDCCSDCKALLEEGSSPQIINKYDYEDFIDEYN